MLTLPTLASKPSPEPGVVFNNWTVIRKLRNRYNNDRGSFFACRCSCGAIHKVARFKLINRPSSECRSCSVRHNQRRSDIPEHWQRTHVGSVWNYILKLERVHGYPAYKPWEKFEDFLDFYCQITETPVEVALTLPITWSYFKFERIDTSKNFSPTNTSFSAFVTGRAYHNRTHRYWRLLQSRGVLCEQLNESYIAFINAFGLRPHNHTLRRNDRTKLHEPGNSYWHS